MAQNKPPYNAPFPVASAPKAADQWNPDDFIWLKLRIDTKAGKTGQATAWTWKDSDPAPSPDNDAQALAVFPIPTGLVSLPGTPQFYGPDKLQPPKTGLNPNQFLSASFGEVIIENLSPASPPTPTASTKPDCPTDGPPRPESPVAICAAEPTRPCLEPPPGPLFVRQWPNSAVAVNFTATPSHRWKLSQRGLSIRPDERTVEDDIRLVSSERSADADGHVDPDRASSQRRW